MAILTMSLSADLLDRLGYIPDGLTAAIGPLLAAQRDSFVRAWVGSSDEQHQRPAEQWILPEDQREAFERFRLIMLSSADV